jgi:hypothetical protein
MHGYLRMTTKFGREIRLQAAWQEKRIKKSGKKDKLKG